MSSITIRPAKLGDEEQIARVHVGSWQTTYKGLFPDDFLAALSIEERTKRWHWILSQLPQKMLQQANFVAEDSNQKIIGFASVGREREENSEFEGEIYAIYLFQSVQGHGTGRRLMKAMGEWLVSNRFKNVRVWVLGENPSRGFYEKMGGKLRPETKTQEFGGKEVLDVSYGWSSCSELAQL